MVWRHLSALALVALLLLTGAAHAGPAKKPTWVVAWSSPLAANAPTHVAPAPSSTTVRNAVHVTAGGSAVRVRVVNDDGRTPLRVGAVTIGRTAAGPALVPGTVTSVTFNGKRQVTVPAGRHLYSDPVALPVRAGEDLSVSIYLPEAANPTNVGMAYTPSHAAADGAGDLTGDVTGAGFLPTMPLSTAYLGAVDVLTTEVSGAVIALGDSITQGAFAVPAANTRWSDLLGDRLRGRLAVANAGISGNDVTTDQTDVGYGQSGLQRLERDVLSQSGVRTVVVALGVNDLSHGCGTPLGVGCSAGRIIDGLKSITAKAHAKRLRVIGVTITAVKGHREYDTPQQLATRRAVNQWIRTTPAFDAVADFDLATRWSGVDVERLHPQNDGGDHLHPSAIGHRAMAEAFELAQF